MKKLILTRGLPASGKSTWAKAWVKEDPKNRIRINNDDIIEELNLGPGFNNDNYNILKRERIIRLKNALTKGLDIVLDNMNLSKNSNEEAREFAEKFGYTIEYKDFLNVSLEDLIIRDSKRKNPVTEKVIRHLYKQFKPEICKILVNKEIHKWIPYNRELFDCIIVDLDGTIAFNKDGRPFYGEGCGEGIKNDIPCDNLISLIDSMFSREGRSCDVFIITGRDESVRIETENWLRNNYINYTNLFMRTTGDYRSGDIVKKEIYDKHIKNKYNVLFVLEDSQKCVNMWRDEGLICLQPNDGKL